MAGDFARWPIGREDDLAAGFVEGVEGVEKLFLRALFPFEKVDVIDEEDVGFAVAAPELVVGAGLDGGDHFVGELFGADEGDAGGGCAGEDVVGDGLHQVGLAESGSAVEKEGVVVFAGRLRDGLGGGGGELVRFSDDKVVERVSGA
jgi:hypothetical protein